MEKIQELIEKIGTTNLIYCGIGLVVVYILGVIIKFIRLKNFKRKVDDIDQKVNGIKSLPLQYRLGRVHSISKNMPEIAPKYQEFSQEYQRITSYYKNTLSVELNEVDEKIYYRKTRKISKRIKGLYKMLSLYETDSKKLLKAMEEITEVENIQRVEIIKIKEIYRNSIDNFEKMRYKVDDFVPHLSNYFNEIDDAFVTLEEMMNTQRFEEASDVTEEVKTKVEWLAGVLKELPDYVVLVRKVIPGKIDSVFKSLEQMKKENYSIDKLDIYPKLDEIKEKLAEASAKVKELNFENISVDLKSILEDIDSLNEKINAEISSFYQFKDVWKNAYNYVTLMYSEYKTCMSAYLKMKDYFVLDKYNFQIEEHFNEFEKIVKDMNDLENIIKSNDFSYTTTLAKISEIRSHTLAHSQYMKEFNNKKEELYIKDNRANDELENINIILLEIKSQIKNKHLPMIDESYKDFIQDARRLALEIQEFKKQKPIDIDELSLKVNEAGSIIYKLYENVKNLIVTVEMIEEAIVFGNRYRNDYLQVNTEITKAEVLFRNGEYTKSLTTIVDIIEKIKPGSYEQLIKKSSK